MAVRPALQPYKTDETLVQHKCCYASAGSKNLLQAVVQHTADPKLYEGQTIGSIHLLYYNDTCECLFSFSQVLTLMFIA